MEYSKQFNHQGITILFDKLELNKMNNKIKWLEENEFKYKQCFIRRVGTWNYKGYSWTLEEINLVSLEVLQNYKKFYDNEISEKELDNFMYFYRAS